MLRVMAWNRFSLLLLCLLVGVLAILREDLRGEVQAAVAHYGVIISNPSNDVVRHTLSMLGMTWWYDFSGSRANPSGFNKSVLVKTPRENMSPRLT